MRILGIETSCDETAVCLLEGSGTPEKDFAFTILGNALYSQIAIHAPYGGVFPNLAKREHSKNLVPILSQALEQANQLHKGPSFVEVSGDKSGTESDGGVLGDLLTHEPELLEQLTIFLATYERPDIDAIAVTYGPGLEPALWVGVNFARALSTVWNIPLVAVNHMEGHILLSMMELTDKTTGHMRPFEFPILSLLISGGHTELVLSESWMQYKLIGQTRDDAVGEAFDKVARLLGLPYPGGPEIGALARTARTDHETAEYTFTPPMLHSNDFDFSFSGIKTEVRKVVTGIPELTDVTRRDIARGFEDAVTTVLVHKTLKAARETGAQTVVVGGGVSANTYIREQLHKGLNANGYAEAELLIPVPELATDNAVMIAIAGYFHALKNDWADPKALRAQGNLKLISAKTEPVSAKTDWSKVPILC